MAFTRGEPQDHPRMNSLTELHLLLYTIPFSKGMADAEAALATLEVRCPITPARVGAESFSQRSRRLGLISQE